MNHINWVQQDPDYKTEYHVLKWRSSHFHEPQARRMIDSALHKEGASSAVSAESSEAGIAEIGLGSAPSVKNGGFGLGYGQDAVSISAQGAERQSNGNSAQVTVRTETERAQDLTADSLAEHVAGSLHYRAVRDIRETADKSMGATEQKETGRNIVASSGQGSIRNRLKQGARFLREEYQKQKAKLKRTLFRTKRVEKQIEAPKKSAKEADKEKILSMQAQNHYLLDSYDRNGQYHMLGK